MRVSLSKLPSPPREYVVNFPRLDGGLNTWELDYRLKDSESPEMVNLWWRAGALCCRDGQSRLTGGVAPGVGWSACERPFWGHGFFHIGSGLYHAPVDEPNVSGLELSLLLDGVPENRGSWFVYGDGLYYKNRGGYVRVSHDRESGTFSAEAVSAYVPTIFINTEPTTAAGDPYQPENRISPQKSVWYTAAQGVRTYRLPVGELDRIDRVEVDGVELPRLEQLPEPPEEEGTEEPEEGGETPTVSGYVADLEQGVVTFDVAPPVHMPVVANTVRITYTKANPDAMASVMDCPHAIVYGGSRELCVVVGGCPAQPNAYFWSGNHIVMDPGYFPMEQYNLAGATQDLITGFGKQQSMLVIFKERGVGRAAMAFEEMDSGRTLITMDYTSINSSVGCDLPGSIQLISNNLVFASRTGGVYRVADSSSAHENNIVLLSRKVNNGLLEGLRRGAGICSFDDGERYWLVCGTEAYLWDYTLSPPSDPSWFYLDNIRGTAFLKTEGACFQLEEEGHVDVYRRSFTDFDGPIRKVYRFATQQMGGYDRLKDVTGVLMAVRGDSNTDIHITYGTDYETREDRTPIRSYSWRFLPRNLTFRHLGMLRFATVVRRRPGCRHVRHFWMRLHNEEAGMDMSVISAQIFYQYQGRQR